MTPWPRATFAAELARDWAHLDVAREAEGVARVLRLLARHEPEAPHARDRDPPRSSRPRPRGRMLAHVLASARAAGCTLATLEVRRPTRPRSRSTKRAGFETMHIRPRYYQDDEDALVMLAELAPAGVG